MIIDLTNAHWIFTPDPDRDVLMVAVETADQRFAAEFGKAEIPAFERLVDELPSTGAVNVGQECVRVLGRDPFVEQELDRRPWYRRLLRPLRR
ncbi:hypothetical protein [Actinoplanes sp. NPDC051494]|uniref:hypothetical protein n=1 Tax=Actinoplanes sp. NPDC051494 TaxID=3363907 RepID=UPI0037940C7B